MRLFIACFLFLGVSSKLSAQEGPCEKEIYASEVLREYHRDQKEIPEELKHLSDEMADIKLCQQGDELKILTHNDTPLEHLVNVGLYFGLPWMTAGQVTYTRLNQGKYDYHLGLGVAGSLGGKSVVLKYGKHIKGSPFYVGGALHPMTTGHNYGVMAGPTIGLSGGKGSINLHAEVGYLGSYEQNVGYSHLPHFTAGVRIRLFKK